MSNPWEFNWQWDDLDTTPEAPKPVTTRQQLASKSAQEAARANDPWTLNFDFGRAEAAAGAQDYERLEPMVTTGDPNAARYVQQEEYQMPELLHEEQSQRDFVRPKGEMFHARSYVPGAVPEQRVITDQMEPWEIFWRSAARGSEDVVQTGYAMAGGDPRDIPTMPLTYLDNPMTVEAAWENPVEATEQAAGMITRLYPMMAAGYFGAAAGGARGAGMVGTEILGSSAGAMAATFAQSMGPRFKQMLMQYPDDPERAWREAGNATLLDVGFTGAGGMLIGAGPLGTTFKQAMFQTFGVKPMAELTGKQLFGNLAIQTLGVQPLVGVANMRAVDAYLGQDTGLTFGDEFLNNIAPSLVQTGAEFAGRAAIAPFSKKTAPGGLPGGGQSEHFIDQIQEATELEKLAADFRTSPELAAKIPEGLKYQIDNGEDPYRGYRAELQSLNTTLRSKLKETLQTFPEGEKKTGEQWYNTLRNAGVKEEELSDYGLDEMLNTNHEQNRKKLWTIDQLRGQFHSNDYPIAMRELVPERYAHGTDNAARYEPTPGGEYENLSTPGMGEYRENLFVLGKDESTSLTGFAQKRGIDIEALRHDVEAPARGELEVIGAKEKLELLRQEHRAFKDFLKKNPEWKSKHARRDPIEDSHWPHEDYGNVLMHTRTGELKFGNDLTTHHIDEVQATVIQEMQGRQTRDMSNEDASRLSRFMFDEFSDKIAAERLGDLSYLDDSVRPGVDISSKFDSLLENLGVDTNKPYAWLTEARDRLIKFHDDPGSFSPEAQQKIRSIIDPDRLTSTIDKMRKDSARAQELVGDALSARDFANSEGNVPLKKSWSKAGLKAEIARAISLGKKHISWTSGAVQAKRNNVGHQLQELSIEKVGSRLGLRNDAPRGQTHGRTIPTYSIHAEKRGGGEAYYNVSMSKDEVERVLGRDLANRAFAKLESPEANTPGQYAVLNQAELSDDTFGGKFHRTLYDEKMVQWAREIGKKFGKKPELKTYDAPNGTEHEMWVMELDPRMSGTMFRYQVGDNPPGKLIAIRQMSIASFRKALELGGIAMPSLAIVRAEDGLPALQGFSNDITFIAPKEMIDPQSGAKVFDADIYSPKMPRTKYIIDPAAKTKLSKEVSKTAAEIKAPGLTDDILTKVSDSGLTALSESHAVVTQFARDVGKLGRGERVMNSDGPAVTQLRDWAQAHPEFRGWLNEKFGKLISAKRAVKQEANTRTGSKERLSSFTLDGILRVMEGQPLKGASAKLDLAAYYRGLQAKKFESIEDIRAESGKLLSREKADELYADLQGDFHRIASYLAQRAAAWEGKPFDEKAHTETAHRFIKEVLHSKGSAKRVAQVFGEGVNATDIKEAKDLLVRLNDTATSYFEAKVPGIVTFDKFGGVIARGDRVSPEEIQMLRDFGIKEITIIQGDDEQARQMALNDLKHLHWQTGEPGAKQVTQAASDTRKVSLTQKQQKQFRKLMQNLISEIKRINPLADVRFLDSFIGFSEDGSAISVNGISHLLGIGVGLGKNKDPFGTARHEAGHTVMWLMDNLKAWKPGEREAFVEWYENVLSKKHADFLENYSPEHRFEEAIVQELGVNRNKWKGYPQAVRNALYRIDGILKAIRTAVKRAFGRKLNPEDIAAMFDAGIMARRAIRKMRRLEAKTRGTTFAKTPDGSLSYQLTRESLRDTVFSSQLDNTLYGKIDNPEIGTKLKKGTGSQWRAELIKQGVKLEELKDAGLDEYLTENASKQMTLQDVIDFREKNRIELHMVMLDDGTKSYVAPAEEEDAAVGSLKKRVSEADKFYDGLKAENVLSTITGRDPQTYNAVHHFINSAVRDGIYTKAREEVRANPERFDDDRRDPRRPAYVYDAKDDVIGKLIVEKNGKEIDFGWVDPINLPLRTGFDQKRSPALHKESLDRHLREILETLEPLFTPETEDSVEIMDDVDRVGVDDSRRFRAIIETKGGKFVDAVTGATREEVKQKFWTFLNQRKFSHRFEYVPHPNRDERYIPVHYSRGNHEAVTSSRTDNLANLQQALDNANEIAEQNWIERRVGIVAASFKRDGELLNELAKKAMLTLVPDSILDVAQQYDDLLTQSASFGLAQSFTTPENLTVPYPSFDRQKWREWRNDSADLADGMTKNSSTKYSTWSLPGGNFRREVLFTAPDLKGEYGESLHTHFGEYEDENVVAHTRLAEFYTEEGEVMNLADEVQSDAMQRASEAREDLIKTYGFKARPDLAFDRESHRAEWSGIQAEARQAEKDRNSIFHNRRATYTMVHELADSIVVGISSGKIDEQARAGLASFGEKYLHNSRRINEYVSEMEYADRAAEFIRHLVSNIEYNFNEDEGAPKGLLALDRSIEAAVYDATGIAGRYDSVDKKQARNDVLAMLRSVELPEQVLNEDTPKPDGINDMHDALFFMISTWRGLSKSLKALSKYEKVPFNSNDLPSLRFAPKRTPHKKSWGLMAFKFAIWDAVQRGHKWVGFTTGEQQNERYASALRKGVERMKFNKKNDKADVDIRLKNGENKKLSGVPRHELSRYIGRGAADQVFDHPDASGELTGDNIMFNLPGVMDHYDKGLPKELKPFLDKLGMKIGMKKIGKMAAGEFKPMHEVYGARLTPQAEKAVRSGEIFRYQVREDDLSGSLESQLDSALMPDSPTKTKLKKGTGVQWRAEMIKQGVKVEELRDSGLEDYFTEYKDQQLSFDQVFQARQGNRIDVVMKVLDDGTEPLVQRSKDVAKAGEPESVFDFARQLEDEYNVRIDEVDDRFRSLISEWITEDDQFDNRDNPRHPYEAKERNETEYELVRYLPNGEIDEYIENYGDDHHYANRQLRTQYNRGEREYVADDVEALEDGTFRIVIRSEWGDGNEVHTVIGESESEAVEAAADYIKEESPYYGIEETESSDWGVWDNSEDKWEETGLTKREAERGAESSNDHHFEYWVERAENEAWDELRGDVDKAQEMYEEALEYELDRGEYNQLQELDGYERSVRRHLASEFRIGGEPGPGGTTRNTDSTKFGSWVLKGGRYYREYVLTTPDLSDQGINMRTHFDNVGRKVMAHFRASDFYTEDGGVAVVSQEFQSDTHQDASGVRQDLIKKAGVAPTPTLGYGYVGFDKLNEAKEALGDQRDNLVDNRNTLRDNFEHNIRDPLLSIFDSIPDEELAKFRPDGSAPTKDMRSDFRIGMYHIVDEVLRVMEGDLKYGDSGNRYSLSEAFQVAYDRVGRHFGQHLPGMSERKFGLLMDMTMRKAEPKTGLFPGAQSLAQEWNFYRRLISSIQKNTKEPAKKLSELNKIYPAAPERLPHKQSWLLMEFKILLHEAIKNGYDWIGLTTGDQQVERYGSALRDAISGIDYDINRETGKADIVIGLNRKDPHKMSGVTEEELARYIGKKAAVDVFHSGQDKGRLEGSGVQFKSPGILNHYDRAIQSETKKFLASLDMKWEPLKIGRRVKTVSTPAPKQEWKLIQRGTRPDGTVQEATVTRNTREEIEAIMERANNMPAETLRDVHGYTAYSHELIEPEATNLPTNDPQERFEALHTVHGVKVSDKARMWIQGSPEQPTKRFYKYQVETPDHANDMVRGGERNPGDTNTPEFRKWFGRSQAVTSDGKPIELYRGEHGRPDGSDIQSRLPSITLTDDASIANLYAEEPNHSRLDPEVIAPRVGKYYARIENPLFVDKGDPFAELGPIAKKLGLPALLKVIEGSNWIESAITNTSVWDEKYSNYYSVRELLSDKPEAINDLYAQSNVLLDSADFVELAKSKGYDGAIHLAWSAAQDAVEYRVFDQGQIKGVNNGGEWSTTDKRVMYQIELPDGLTHADPAVNTPRFKVWFKRSKIIDAVGHPLRVFHGSLKTFSAFNSGWGTNEGFFGRRFYFTNHPGDASDNYASRKGPDNRYKMSKAIDRGDVTYEDEYWAGTDNEGVVYPVYLSIQNPVIVGSSSETRFGYRDMVRLAQAAKHAEGLTKIFDGHGKLSEVLTEIMINEVPGSGDYIPANELIKRIREHDGVYEIMDENGDNAYAEVLRQAFETMGYDGIVDYGVNSRWKWIKHQNVEHFIAFRPNQIKSVFNRGTWSSRLDDIHYQVSTDDPVSSPKFRAWFSDGLLQTADGEPLPVFHATGSDFDKFRRAKYDIGFHIGTAGQANERAEVKSLNSEISGVQYTPNVMKLYTNIRNPITLKDLGGWDTPSVWYQLLNMADDPNNKKAPLTKEEVLEFALQYQDAHGVWKPNSLFQLKKLLSSKGYDSVVYNNKFEIEGKVAAEKRLEAANINLRKAIEAKFPGREPWRMDPNLSPAEYAEVLAAERHVKQIKDQQVPSYIAFWPTQLKSVFNKGTWSGNKRSVMYQAQWEDAPQSSSFLDSLREGFAGEWENLDEEASLSSSDANLRKVYRKDWLDMRKGPNQFQFALMLRGTPIGRINGIINGDTARINWIGIVGGDDGLGDGAVRHLGAMLRLALPNEVRLLTGLRKGPEEAYAAEEQKAAKKPAPSGPSATKVRTPGGSQEDPLIEYYRNLGRS